MSAYFLSQDPLLKRKKKHQFRSRFQQAHLLKLHLNSSATRGNPFGKRPSLNGICIEAMAVSSAAAQRRQCVRDTAHKAASAITINLAMTELSQCLSLQGIKRHKWLSRAKLLCSPLRSSVPAVHSILFSRSVVPTQAVRV